MFKEISLDIDYSVLVDYVIKIVNERYPNCNSSASQIAIQCRKDVKDEEKQLIESTLSLEYDWNNFDPDTMKKPPLIPKEKRLKQIDFLLTPDFFKNTPVEDLNNSLSKNFKIMRGRIMNMHHKSALTWHYDASPRLHIPIKINDGSFMVLEDEIIRFKVGNAYVIDTTKMHTSIWFYVFPMMGIWSRF
jgi:hypothetical protein